MNAFDWIELLMKLALLVGFVFVLPWAPLFRRWLKSYARQLEPFEYFAYGGSMPKRWVVASWTLGGDFIFYYSDGSHEFVSAARVRQP